jgi:hypothetical protein
MEWYTNELSFFYISKLHQPFLNAHESLNYPCIIKKLNSQSWAFQLPMCN